MWGRCWGQWKDYIWVSEDGNLGYLQETLSQFSHITFCFHRIITISFPSCIATVVQRHCFCSVTLLSFQHSHSHLFQDHQVKKLLMRPQGTQPCFKYVLTCTLNIVAYFLSLSKSLRLWWYRLFIYLILQKNCLSNTTIIIDFHNDHFNWNHLGFPKGSHSRAI